MTNKKLEWTRLGLYLLLSFGLMYIPAFIMNKTLSYHEWFESGRYFWPSLLTACSPAIANVLTRLITKEGLKDSMLHLRLKGHVKYYLLALSLPILYALFGGLLITLVFGHFDWKEITDRTSPLMMVSGILTVMSSSALVAFVTFGEEFGWRAYMNQKMESLMGFYPTVFVGGILWGLWHMPLTIEGHNFGTDYWGFPYLGVITMCIECVFVGCMMMWLTKKTGSVYPAAICHAVNNNGILPMANMMLSGFGEDEEPASLFAQFCLLMVPAVIFGTVFLILMIRDKKKGKLPEASAF